MKHLWRSGGWVSSLDQFFLKIYINLSLIIWETKTRSQTESHEFHGKSWVFLRSSIIRCCSKSKHFHVYILAPHGCFINTNIYSFGHFWNSHWREHNGYFILSISSSAVPSSVERHTVHRRATLWEAPPSRRAVAACPLHSFSSIRYNGIFCSFVFQKSHEILAKFNIRLDLRSLRLPANSILLQLPRLGKRLICAIWASSRYTHSLFDLLLSGFWSPDAFRSAAEKFWEVGHHPKHTTYSTHQERAPFIHLLCRLEKGSLSHERISPVATINPLHEHITKNYFSNEAA